MRFRTIGVSVVGRVRIELRRGCFCGACLSDTGPQETAESLRARIVMALSRRPWLLQWYRNELYLRLADLYNPGGA